MFEICSMRHLLVLTLTIDLVACGDGPVAPTESASGAGSLMSVLASAPPPPSGQVTVGDLSLWPWTGVDLSGTISDPMNLIFFGPVDVVSLRAALVSLDGDRTAYGFPDAPPFNCTWTDANGEMQTAYTDGDGWVANAVQLQCGDYSPFRFHIRLFAAGSAVVGGAHFDLLIPNTPEHRVLSWDVPQQLVTVDFLRTGLATASAAIVNPPGTAQGIEKVIYDGIPDALKVAFGLPPGPAPGATVAIPDDGVATVLTLSSRPPVASDLVTYTRHLPFESIAPRPFCQQGPADYVHISGPVEITVSTRVNELGMLESHNTLRGDLSVTPIDVSTGQPSGPTFRAQISEIDNAGVSANGTSVNAVRLRKGLPPGRAFQKLHLVTGPNGAAQFMSSETCD